METIKNKTKHVCQGLELGMKRWSTEEFGGIENTPYDIIMMDACHYMFIKPYRLHRPSQVALVVKNLPGQCRRHNRRESDPRVQEIPWRRAWQLTAVFLPGEIRVNHNIN